jgi:hypothetical protein
MLVHQFQENFTSSIPVDGRLPLPVVDESVTILIQIGWLILFRVLPKLTVTVVLENVPNAVVSVGGLVAITEKEEGLNPIP